MRNFQKLILVGSASVVLAANALSQTSPNGFIFPQCTYTADVSAFNAGWDLEFSQPWGRNAVLWWDLVRNASGRGSQPRVGSIPVWDVRSRGGVGTVGHVGYVVDTFQGGIVVRHSNWPSGSGIKVERFYFQSGNSLRVRKEGESTFRTLKGYLYPPTSNETLIVRPGDANFTKSGAYWWSFADGWYTYANGSVLDCWAKWTFNVNTARNYRFEPYIPGTNATSLGQYDIYVNGSHWRRFHVDQLPLYNVWASGPTLQIPANARVEVVISDNNGRRYPEKIGVSSFRLVPL